MTSNMISAHMKAKVASTSPHKKKMTKLRIKGHRHKHTKSTHKRHVPSNDFNDFNDFPNIEQPQTVHKVAHNLEQATGLNNHKSSLLAQLGRIAQTLHRKPNHAPSTVSSTPLTPPVIHQIQPTFEQKPGDQYKTASPVQLCQASKGIGNTVLRGPAQVNSFRNIFLQPLPIFSAADTSSVTGMTTALQELLQPLLDGGWFRVVGEKNRLPLCYFSISGDLQCIDWTSKSSRNGQEQMSGSLQRSAIVSVEWCVDGFVLHVHKGSNNVALKLLTKNNTLKQAWCIGITCLLEMP